MKTVAMIFTLAPVGPHEIDLGADQFGEPVTTLPSIGHPKRQCPVKIRFGRSRCGSCNEP